MKHKYHIRPCGGNTRAWCLVRCHDDWTELDCFGSYTTSLSLDNLLKYAKHLTPQPGDEVRLTPMVRS